MTTYTVNELYDKRAELAGEIVQAEKKVRELRGDLAHIEAAIRILRPATVLEKVVPRLILNYMREHAGEVVVIADILPLAIGNRALGAHERAKLGVTIYSALMKMSNKGIVKRAGEGAPQSRWTLVGEA
jgi:hypothetical protein